MAARRQQQNVILQAPTEANRRPLDTFPQYMRQLGHTVLDGHHDIKFHKAAEQRATAADWGKRRGFTLGPDVDINDDGVNDVVLYTREGVPVVINGYELKKSEFMIRKKYHEANPDAGAKKRVGGYSGFKKSYRNDAEAEQYQAAFRPGFAKLRKSPVRAADAGDSLYKQFSTIVKDTLIPFANAEAANVNPAIATLPGKVIPLSSITAHYYIAWFLDYLWNHDDMNDIVENIRAKYMTAAKRCEMFRKAIAKHSDTVADIIETDDVWTQMEALCQSDDTVFPDLAEMGLDIAGLDAGVQNREVPRDDDDSIDAKAWRAFTKETMTREILSLKERLIEEIFGDQDGQ